MKIGLMPQDHLSIMRLVIISLCAVLPWTGMLAPRGCFGLDGAAGGAVSAAFSTPETPRGASNLLTITTLSGFNEGHLITFPDSTTLSIDCASGNITTLSHFNADHCNGDQQYNRNNVFLGQVLYNKDGVTVTVVATNGRKIGDADGDCTSSDENACSMVLWIKYMGFDYLSGGDLTGSKEGPLGDALAARGARIDVYKVHHHGSSLSSFSGFLGDILPEYAVVSGHATSLKADTLSRLKNAGVRMIYDTFNDHADPQFKYSGGDIKITTDGRTYSFSAPNFNDGTFQVDEYVLPEVIPPHLLITEVALGAHSAPENHDWVELYLPPDASPVNLASLYWTDLDEVQRAATGIVTLMPGDVVILHDAPGPSESDMTGKELNGNGWWDIYIAYPGLGIWNTYHDEFVICSQNSSMPDPYKIIDAVVWSDDDGSMFPDQAADGNYVIGTYQWGDPTFGVGLFSAAQEGPAIGDINSGYAQRLTSVDTNSVRDWTMSATHSQGTPPPTPTPIPTPPPVVKLVLNSSSLEAGAALNLGVVVQPVNGKPFDAYAVIIGAAGIFSIQPGSRLRQGIAPIAHDIQALPRIHSGMLLNMTVPDGVSGDYRVIAGLVDAGRTVRSPGGAFTYDIVSLTVR